MKEKNLTSDTFRNFLFFIIFGGEWIDDDKINNL